MLQAQQYIYVYTALYSWLLYKLSDKVWIYTAFHNYIIIFTGTVYFLV